MGLLPTKNPSWNQLDPAGNPSCIFLLPGPPFLLIFCPFRAVLILPELRSPALTEALL